MPRILLSKNRVLDVSLDVAIRVEGEWKDPKVRYITIGDATYKRGEIASVQKGGTNRKAYDLGVGEDYKVVKQFEVFLESLKEKKLPQPAEWYGYLITKIPGMVVNPLLGLVHPTTVQWAIDEGAISRSATGAWAIVDNSLGNGDVNISRYVEISNKLKALAELHNKKSFAQKQNAAELDAMVDKMEGLFEDMQAPTPEEIDAALN